MKSKNEIYRRLEKLTARYRHRYVESTQVKSPLNCHYNIEHIQKTVRESKIWDKAVSPRIQSTLIVLNNQESVRICSYGSDDSSKWTGQICDSEEISSPCPYFKPKVTKEEAFREFSEILGDDQKTLALYPDVANIQWVLDDRYSLRKGFWIIITRAWRRLVNGFRSDSSHRSLQE